MSADERLRLDKWLWAARLFKTRAKAKEAITGGKVHTDGQRAKPAKEISVGTMLRVRRGDDEVLLEVTMLSEQRRGAAEAAELYRETPASIEARTEAQARRKAAREAIELPASRPDRRDRRALERIKRGTSE
ncbi:MAG: RNA-binding protein [Gammaproteobacteria bacterium]|nr:RNA-binding protein [Gammaproteobacteria bacterium]